MGSMRSGAAGMAVDWAGRIGRRRPYRSALALLVGCAIACGSRTALDAGPEDSEDVTPVGAGGTPATSDSGGGTLVGAGAISATGGYGDVCFVSTGGTLPTGDCEGTPRSSRTIPFDAPPNDDGWYVEGRVDGEPLKFEGDDVFVGGDGIDNALLRFSLAGAQLWLWHDREGVLRLPFSEGVEFVCFSLEEDRVENAISFASEQLTRLDCDSEEEAPMYFRFNGGNTAVMLDHLGENAALYDTRGVCDAYSCEFEFVDRENGIWVLWLDTWVAPGTSSEFTRSALAHWHGSFSGACGRGGTITVSEDHWVEIAIDSMGPLESCPGDPIDGELDGLVPNPPRP